MTADQNSVDLPDTDGAAEAAAEETSTGLPGSNVEARTFQHIPCRKGGPSQADKDFAKQVGPRLDGTLEGNNLTAERVCCIRRVVETVMARGLPRRAAQNAVATIIVESGARNVTGGDRDSVGLFQQRDPWGTKAQRLDPTWATNAFLDVMLRAYLHWSWLKAPVGEVCQKVQRSAFPGRYQLQAADAATLVYALAPTSALLAFGDRGRDIAALQRALAKALKRRLDDDGEFGPKTEDAVKDFQKREKLEPDGVAGPKTRAALRRAAPGEAAELALPGEAETGGSDTAGDALEEPATKAAPDGADPAAESEEGRDAAEAAAGGAGGVKVNPGVRIGPVGKRLLRVLGHYPGKAKIYVTSALRPGRGSHHGGLVYKGSPTAALDVGAGGLTPEGERRMRDLAKWLYDNFADLTVELIHSTPFKDDRGFYVKNQVKHPGGGGVYDEETRLAHRDHVHFATSRALAERILARLEK